MFASVGADGSVRMFDLRHLEHSTIIYEDPQHRPLLRLAWNRQDPSYLATISMDACEVCVYTLSITKYFINPLKCQVVILDVRVPCTPVARLSNHRACVNGIAWAPHSSCHICTAGTYKYCMHACFYHVDEFTVFDVRKLINDYHFRFFEFIQVMTIKP